MARLEDLSWMRIGSKGVLCPCSGEKASTFDARGARGKVDCDARCRYSVRAAHVLGVVVIGLKWRYPVNEMQFMPDLWAGE